jgi:predicted nuclease of predicted toxin-antitoxin system
MDENRVALYNHLKAIIALATAREFNAVLWTQDSDFKNLSNVRYSPEE